MQATPRAPYQTPGTPRFAKKPLGPSNSIIPKNPKCELSAPSLPDSSMNATLIFFDRYEAVQARVNCGPNLARFERSQVRARAVVVALHLHLLSVLLLLYERVA